MTTDNPAGFDPARYLTKLSRRAKTSDGGWRTVELDYMEVKYRLLWLRTEHPDAEIETLFVKEIERDGSPGYMFRASVRIPGGGSATGYGTETADDWKDPAEKSETKALGRALAALGYGTQFCEDLDYGAGNAERVVDAPVDPKRPQQRPAPTRSAAEIPMSERRAVAAASASGTDRPATEPQIKAIYAIARGAHVMDDGALEEWCRERYGTVPAELTRRQASEVIDALKQGVPAATAAEHPSAGDFRPATEAQRRMLKAVVASLEPREARREAYLQAAAAGHDWTAEALSEAEAATLITELRGEMLTQGSSKQPAGATS